MSLRKDTIAITLPNDIAKTERLGGSFIEKIKKYFILAFEALNNQGLNTTQGLRKFTAFKLPRFNKKNIIRIAVPIIAVLFLAVIVKMAFTPSQNPSVQGVVNIEDAKPLATMDINREFQFPLRDQEGKEVGKLSYTLETAELRKQIIVKGKRATAVEGRVFLIINLKIANVLDQGVEVNTRDYIRISVNGNMEEKFAPDIHNDPVEVQAISTKTTRVGIAINETDSNIEVQVGEINGAKEYIKLSF
jgi:hypothetical protein